MSLEIPPAKRVTKFSSATPVPQLTSRKTHQTPALSIIVVVYSMPNQAERTLHSLSPGYQTGVAVADYEIIVVENTSTNLLGEGRALAHGENYRYCLREESEPTPIHAINDAVRSARGEYVAIMIDGARMLSPGVVGNLLTALAMSSNAVVGVPGYHLGHELQQVAAAKGYTEQTEAALLQQIAWPADGYRLFDICCPSGTSAGGILKPISECNCLALRKSLFNEIGGYDPAFKGRGGGMVNLDFYKRAVEHPDTQLVILPGEGSFHQFHGGETTGGADGDRDALMRSILGEYYKLRGEPFSPPEKRAIFLGAIPDSAVKFLRKAAETVIRLNDLEKPDQDIT